MQFRIRFSPRPLLQGQGFLTWALTDRSLELLVGNWDTAVHWAPVLPQTHARCVRCDYHPTAITRRDAPAPIRQFLRVAKPSARALRLLYHGVGRDIQGAMALSTRGDVTLYDPYHPSAAVRAIPRSSFDEIHSVYVLCVLTPEQGKIELGRMRRWLSDTGVAIVTVRR